MGSMWLFLSCAAVLAAGTQTALDLLGQEENELEQRRQDFDEWCQKEISTQEGLRRELMDLESQDLPEEHFQVPAKLLELARRLETSTNDLSIAQLTLQGLQALPTRRGLEKLLREATELVARLSGGEGRASLAAELEMQKAEQRNASERLAAREAKALAAQSGRKVLETALGQTEAALSEAAGLCGLGRRVLKHGEDTGKMLSRKALELLGMLEASPDVSPPPAPSAAVATAGATTQGVGQLVTLSQQLLAEQKEIRAQMEELKQMKTEPVKDIPQMPVPQMSVSAMPVSTPPAEPLLKEVKEVVPVPQAMPEVSTTVPSIPPPKRKHKAMSLAADPKPPRDEDGPRLPAPKDFPAALRGGWQGLLAKKRAEVKKKPKEESSIMELMQTPKTYTAWQPDKAAPEKKDELLAAEKAFDDDDLSMSPKKGKSFLQLENDEPLAFFQLGSVMDLAPSFAAPHPVSEVSVFLGKFAELTKSSTLLELSKSQLAKKDLENLVRKFQAEPVDPSAEICHSLGGDESVAAELENHYLQAKARLTSQALRKELAARERLVTAFRNTSQRFAALHLMLQQSFQNEEGRLQTLEQQLTQLESRKQRPAEELRGLFLEVKRSSQQMQEDLEERLAGAAARQQEADRLEEQGLQQLRVRLRADSKPSKPSASVAKLCALAAESWEKSRLQHGLELAALRTAKALAEA